MAGPLAPAKLQSVIGTAWATGTSQAVTIQPQALNSTLVVLVFNTSVVSAGFAATQVSGSICNSWFRLANATCTYGSVDAWVGFPTVVTGISSVTVNFAASQSAFVMIDEWANVNASWWLNNPSTVVTSNGSAASWGVTVAPDALNCVMYAAELSQTSTISTQPGAPWTVIVNSSNAQYAYAVSGVTPSQAATWTSSGSTAYAALGFTLYPAQGIGDLTWNDPSAQSNNAVTAPAAAPDMLDFIGDNLALRGTGVFSGCAVGPQTGANAVWQNLAGVALFNWNAIQISSSSQTMPPGDNNNPRKDLICIRPDGAIVYLTGQPAANPVLPQPNWWPFISLAQIDVPKSATVLDNGTSTANAHITDKRSFLTAAPGVQDWAVAPFDPFGNQCYETVSRRYVSNQATGLISGQLFLYLIWLPAGFTVQRINFWSGATAAATPTHYWFGLWSRTLVQLCLTADQTSSAWAANAQKQLVVASSIDNPTASSFVTRYAGLYYVGIMVAATTVPTLMGVPGSNQSLMQQNPALIFSSGSALTTPPAYTPAAVSGAVPSSGTGYAYAIVSH